jgi:hypothetical protein
MSYLMIQTQTHIAVTNRRLQHSLKQTDEQCPQSSLQTVGKAFEARELTLPNQSSSSGWLTHCQPNLPAVFVDYRLFHGSRRRSRQMARVCGYIGLFGVLLGRSQILCLASSPGSYGGYRHGLSHKGLTIRSPCYPNASTCELLGFPCLTSLQFCLSRRGIFISRTAFGN